VVGPAHGVLGFVDRLFQVVETIALPSLGRRAATDAVTASSEAQHGLKQAERQPGGEAERADLGQRQEPGIGQPRGRPAGLTGQQSKSRAKASYLRVVRGWAFDPDGREAAVLKGWVESRFGLMPRHHGESLREPGSAA